MGACVIRYRNPNYYTLCSNLTNERGMIYFTISEKQLHPEKIQGIAIILIATHKVLNMYLLECYGGRIVKISLWSLAEKKGIYLPTGKIIEYRLMFIYEMFTSTPTSVMNIIFTPCNSVESNMRLIESSLPYKKMLLTKKIETFSDKMVRYYQKKEKYLNIMLLGGNGVGKSSFVKELSKIICKTPIKPQIGNHSSYQMSTTTRYESYMINEWKDLTIKLIDTPSFTNSTSFRSLYQRLLAPPEDYSKVIHSVIIFVNPCSLPSMQTAQQIIKVLAKCYIYYNLAIVCWEYLSPVYEDYFINKTHYTFLKALQTNIDYYPMLLRYYPISNLRCKEGNIQAQLTMLECFYNALELGASFYQQHKPLHVIYDDKVIDIRHREPASKTISNFIKDALLADLLFEIAEKTLDKVFVKRKYGRQGKCGYITIDSELKSEKDRPLEDFTEKEDNFRLLNLYSEPSFFGTLIE